MCGIVGICPSIEEGLFKFALNKLTHRGPDGYGVWKNDNHSLMLGHRRLSILDTSEGGKQPMHYKDRYVVTFNGEIYNFIEIRKELQSLGYSFESESDTEVLLVAFHHWKEKCLLKFNGMWAFAIFDQTQNKLFLSRDRFGKKPLFYHQSGDKFIFASEMKAIMPLLDSINISKDFDWCKKNPMVYEATEKTLIDGIKRFPAGHYAYFDLSDKRNLSPIKYWNTIDNLVQVPSTYEEQVAQFKELFMDACKIRMRSDVPIGTSLSGGLDSSAIICTLNKIDQQENSERVSKNWQSAYIASFPNSFVDETKYAKEVTDFLGIKGNFIEINPNKCIEKLEYSTYIFEELYPTPPMPMMQTYQAMKNGGVTVSIDGHGADELMAGYNYNIYETFFDAKFDIKQIKNAVIARTALFDGVGSDSKWMYEYIYFRARILGISTVHLANKLPFIKDRFIMPLKRYKFHEQLGHLNSLLYSLFEETIMPSLLRNYDRYSMSAGIEIRMPFLDHRVVSFLLSVPYDSKIRNGYTKAILRDALRDIMPPNIVNRKSKIGYSAPLNEWISNEWKEFLMDTMNSQLFNNSNFVDKNETKKLMTNVMNAEKPDFTKSIYAWQSISPYFWEEYFFKKLNTKF
jgi:asparagine synthase (glutamine-hydrolysing)